MTARKLRLMAVLPALARGGAEVQLAHLLLALPQDTFECELVTLLSADVDDVLAARLSARRLPWHDLAVARLANKPMGLRHATANLLRARGGLGARVAGFQPDVVYSRLWYAGVAVASLDRRRLGFAHVANEENALGNLDDRGRLKRLLRRMVVRQADRWVAPTRGLHDELVRGGASASRGQVIYNATPLPELTPIPRVPGPVRFAAMGRLVPAKGFDRLLEAGRLLRQNGVPFALDIAGEGPERAALERRAHELGLADAVRFHGYIGEPLAFLRGRDAFVLSSRSEGFANVLAEAMACQLPTVAFDIHFGPAELIVPGVSGFLVPDGDVAGLAGRMGELAGDPALRRIFGEAGRARAEELFSVPRMAARFGELFVELAGQAPGERRRLNVRNSWKRA